MPTPAARTRSVYQLRVVLHGVSPLIWRRPLVPGDASVAGDARRVADRFRLGR